MILSLACDTILILSQEALFCYPHHFRLLYSPQHSWGIRIFIYPEQNLRAYPGILRGTAEWDETYKQRAVVEKCINHFKEHLCVAVRKTQNEKTLHADLLLAGITQLITVILSDKIKHPEYIRSLKPLIA